MTSNSTKSPVLGLEAETAVYLLDDWFDPIEAGLRDRVRELIQMLIESEKPFGLCRDLGPSPHPRALLGLALRRLPARSLFHA